MGIKVALRHRTEYRYDRPVALGPQIIKLRPAAHCRTPISGYSLEITPAQHLLHWQQDQHGNFAARLILPEKIREFALEVRLVAELTPINPFDFLLEPGAERYPIQYQASEARDLAPYQAVEPPSASFAAFLARVRKGEQDTVAFLIELTQSVRDEVGYISRLDPGTQSSEETLTRRAGSCRDSAWLLVEALRHTGFAARFVSGYLIQLAGPKKDPERDSSADAEKPSVSDSAELHAWAEVFLPGAGWIGLDPTSGLLTSEGHIPLASASHPEDAAPVRGTVESCHTEFHYTTIVERVAEATDLAMGLAMDLATPFSEAEWRCVQQTAHVIDTEIAQQDIRLTMGGEPTFVAIDEPESPQWQIEALGESKRARGMAMIQRIAAAAAPGYLLHYGQGKWCAGEALPRWALSCYWRPDGVPIWENPQLIARADHDYGFMVEDAHRFATALMRRLEVDPKNLLAGYDPEAEVPAAYVLPLRRRQDVEGRIFWSSQLWFPPPEKLLLFPGNSPAGYRISLDVLPWVAPDTIRYEREKHSFAGWVKLPAHPTRRPELFSAPAAEAHDPLPPEPENDETAAEKIRPALCVEARNGRLHVFLPYASQLADCLDLLSAIEDTCEHLKTPIWVEGYTPPVDPRLRSLSITPDPGVLEVNLPPAANWDELETIHKLVFAIAREQRLTAEKFAHDGRHMATGGGSHIVIGGAMASESPFLRRPDLLRSMLIFWQHHPSLSYLFSGAFIGPTSQFPRLDEARMDSLYELEIAFRQLPSGECAPEVLDGLFRNLLVDMTGNTHRAEFCIDKLYPPPGRGLPLGLLELRAFEMAPHVRMGLVELLLIRALVCMFWKQPFMSGLIRWGTTLHDRFLLPYFAQQDFLAVLGALREAGFDLQARWFDAHFEFRFPRIGSITAQGVELELRTALEPWNVLAEEATSSGTARSVDSSLERLQVKVSGLTPDSRYVITCNGRQVPLHQGQKPGEAVGGVRFRARRLTSALHPTIPVHAPLTFEILDRWKSRAIGRCTYSVTTPDGFGYDRLPANGAEAEKRRRERFLSVEPCQETVTIPPEETNPAFPLTLDLRWPAPTDTRGRA